MPVDGPDVYVTMLLHTMACKYGMLPSELLRRGDTLDLKVFDTALKYENYVREKHETGKEPAPKLTQAQMQEMVERVKGKKK